jgi:hypothetical protein
MTQHDDIAIVRTSDTVFRVTVTADGSSTVHDVTVSPQDVDRYAPGAQPERLLRASFEFLLEREPKDSILRRFDLPVIERYFPDYPRRIRETLT